MKSYKTLKTNYLDKKLKIFPVIENKKEPMIPAWQIDCSCDKLQVSYWFENAPNCNWGLPCSQNDLFVLDIDVHNINGLANAKKLFNDLGINEINTLSQKTPSGGIHLIFKSDDDLKAVINSSNSFADYPGIDIRTDGYILVYPSTINNVGYEFKDITKDINKMPEALKNFILSQKSLQKSERREHTEYVRPEKVEEGGRDIALFEYINDLYFKTRLTFDEIMLLAENFNENTCEPPLPKRTIKYKVNKVFKKDRGKCMFIKLNGEDDEDVRLCDVSSTIESEIE